MARSLGRCGVREEHRVSMRDRRAEVRELDSIFSNDTNHSVRRDFTLCG